MPTVNGGKKLRAYADATSVLASLPLEGGVSCPKTVTSHPEVASQRCLDLLLRDKGLVTRD